MTAFSPSLAASAAALAAVPAAVTSGSTSSASPGLPLPAVGEVDTDHIGRMARGQGRVQDPVFRVCRDDDQAGLG